MVAPGLATRPTAYTETIAAHRAQSCGRTLVGTQVSITAEDMHGRLHLVVDARISLVEVVDAKTACHIVVLHPGQTRGGNDLEQVDSRRRQPRVWNLIVRK